YTTLFRSDQRRFRVVSRRRSFGFQILLNGLDCDPQVQSGTGYHAATAAFTSGGCALRSGSTGIDEQAFELQSTRQPGAAVSTSASCRGLRQNSTAGEAAQAAGIEPAFVQGAGVGGRCDRLHIRSLGTVAQQGRNIPHFVEFGVFFDVEQFDVAADHPRQNRFPYVAHFMRGHAASRAITDQVSIEVTATGTLHSMAEKVLADQQRLHLAQFERAQDSPQAGNAAGVAPCLVQSLVHKLAAAATFPIFRDALSLGANLVARNVPKVGMEMPQQRLLYIGMQLRFQHRTVNVLASQDPLIEDATFERILEYLGNSFEMLADFIVDATLGMTAVVTRITVTAAFARERLKQAFALGQFSQAKIEHASPMPIDQYDAQAWERAQQ